MYWGGGKADLEETAAVTNYSGNKDTKDRPRGTQSSPSLLIVLLKWKMVNGKPVYSEIPSDWFAVKPTKQPMLIDAGALFPLKAVG